jgi:hypothetical protein
MSTEATPIQPAVLITIIGESVLRDRIVKLIKSKGVTGYTISEVRGEGGHGWEILLATTPTLRLRRSYRWKLLTTFSVP